MKRPARTGSIAAAVALFGDSGHRRPGPAAAGARAAAQLPGHRARPLPAGGGRAGAAAVPRRRQRRGAAVQPRPAPLGLRVGEAARTTTSASAPTTTSSTRAGYPVIKHRTFGRAVPPSAPPAGARGVGCRAPRCSGAARGRRRGVPPGLDRQHLGDELRLAVRARPSRRSTGARRWPAACTTPARAASRRTTATAATSIFQIGTAYFGCRDEQGRFDLERLKDLVAGAPVRAIEIKLSQGAKPGLGGLLPGAEGLRGDRRDPRRAGGRRLHQPVPPRRVLRRRQPARLGRAARRRDRPAGRDQVRGRRHGLLGRADAT